MSESNRNFGFELFKCEIKESKSNEFWSTTNGNTKNNAFILFGVPVGTVFADSVKLLESVECNLDTNH